MAFLARALLLLCGLQGTVLSVKAGSVLGITVFLLLCLLLLYLLVRNLAKRCGSLELSSLKGPDVDIFYGGFVCSCRKGFTLVDEVFCVRNEDEDEEAEGSGEAATTPSAPTVTTHEVAPTRQPSAVTVGGLVAIIVCCVLVVVVVVFLSQHILFSGILSVHVQQHCGARQLECLSWPEDPQDLEWFYERLVSKILKDAEVKTLDKGVPKPDIPPGNDIQLENIEAQQ